MREESYADFCSSEKIQTDRVYKIRILVGMVKYRIHLQYILF